MASVPYLFPKRLEGPVTDNSSSDANGLLADVLASLLSGQPAPNAGFLSAPLPPSSLNPFADFTYAGLGGIISEGFRRRSSWNDRFAHWQSPESDTEKRSIQRAERLVNDAIAGNAWLQGQSVRIAGQGSYFNRTNVRTEADIDLRAVHPALEIEYHENVHIPSATSILAYGDAGLTARQIFTGMRVNLVKALGTAVGAHNVDPGNKAIRIKGVTGSRAEIDIVPAMRFHFIEWRDSQQRYLTTEGVAILGKDDGRWTWNFPAQHAANGRDKRRRTKLRFKRMVRIFKRLQGDMAAAGVRSARVPSFLVECLVYAVEDDNFLIETDDNYDRVRRIAHRMRALILNDNNRRMLEINEVKFLFHPRQSWTHAQALAFVDAIIAHLGNA